MVGSAALLGLFMADAEAHEVDVQTFAIASVHTDGIVAQPLDEQVSQPPIATPYDATIGYAPTTMHDGPVLTIGKSPCQPARALPQPAMSTIGQRRRTALYPTIVLAACAEGVPIALLDALVARESRYNPAAISPKGAIGLTQLMPATVAALGTGNPWSTYANLKGGARYLRQQLDTFGRYDLALAAYNAGPGNVRRHKGVPPFAETRGYVEDVLATLLRARPLAMSMPKSSGGAGRRSVFLAVYPAPVLLPRMTAP